MQRHILNKRKRPAHTQKLDLSEEKPGESNGKTHQKQHLRKIIQISKNG